ASGAGDVADATPIATPVRARNENHHGTRVRKTESSENSPGPARTSAPRAAMFVTGSSAPPFVAQIGLPLWAVSVAVAIAPIARAGPMGFRRPSAVNPPPAN